MSDIATWYLAQLDEDERVARAATPGPWMALDGGVRDLEEPTAWPVSCTESERDLPDRTHIARHDPAHVLADITAKRRIVEEHSVQNVPVLEVRGEVVMSGPECRRCADWDKADMDGPPNAKYPCQTLRLLTSALSDRPGYDPAWAPEEES